MPDYTIINNDEFKMMLSTPDDSNLSNNLAEGDEYIVGLYPNDIYYFKNSEPKAFPERPNYPVDFDYDSEQWVWNVDASWDALRYERDRKLTNEVDPIISNSVRFNSMSEEKQQVYLNYRQALLDLPQNTVDPREPVWPTPPGS